MRTEDVSYLQEHADDLDLSEPLTITKHGEPAYVIESYADWERREEAKALLTMLSYAEEDIKQGRVLTSEQIRQNLESLRNSN